MSDKAVRRRVAACVEAYESACADGGSALLEDFVPPLGEPAHLPALCELVRTEIERRWQQGATTRLDEYRGRFPQLFDHPSVLAEVAFEEYRQRCECGDAVHPDEYAEAFQLDVRHWPHSSVSGVLASGSASADECPAETTMTVEQPRPGGQFAGFELLTELGRGAFATAYLAKQRDLANRYVVLKISRRFAGESQTLAQLQHTNIVPVYSTHRQGNWHAICMPFLGSTTLADVLRDLRKNGPLPHSGEGLVSTIKNKERSTHEWSGIGSDPTMNGSSADGLAAAEPLPAPYQHLRRLSYVDAVLWLAVRVADGLEHAHRRGVLHLDLKPANILLRDDGEPMVLDFNLSATHSGETAASAAAKGGTLPYMSPEQLRALRGTVMLGRCAPGAAVDARSDVFSLGVVLFELLSGRLPFAVPADSTDEALADQIVKRTAGPPAVRLANHQVTPAVEAILRRCLEPDPNRRYQTAGQLVEDLQRQLTHRPLMHAREPSRIERAQKWSRRHPRLASGSTVATATAILIAVLAGLYVEAKRQVVRQEVRNALATFEAESLAAQFHLNAPDSARHERERGLHLAREALAGVGGIDDHPWSPREIFKRLDAAEHRRLLDAVGDLALAMGAHTEEASEAERLAQIAESCYAPDEMPQAVWRLRAAISRKQGDRSQAEFYDRRASETPIRSP
ncbi:MAG: serine/threonine-protein kinase, partial [Pirellulales bacterium]